MAKVGITLSVEGAQASAQAIEQVAQRGALSFERFQTTLQRAGTGADFLEAKTKKLNRGINDAAGAVQLLSPVLGGLAGNFGILASTVGNVSDLFGTFANVLLKNPLGLAAIAITGAITAYSFFSKKTEEAATSTVSFTTTISRANELLAELKKQAAETAEDKLVKLKDGLEQARSAAEKAAKNFAEVSAKTVEIKTSAGLTAEQLDLVAKQMETSTTKGEALRKMFENSNRLRNAETLQEYNRELRNLTIEQGSARLAVDAANKALAEQARIVAGVDFKNVSNSLQAFQDEIDPRAAIERQHQEDIRKIDEAARNRVAGFDEIEANRLVALADAKRKKRLEDLTPKDIARAGPREVVDKTAEQFDRLRATLDPLIAAEREAANAVLILDSALAAGLVTEEEAIRLKQELARRTEEQTTAGRENARVIAEGISIVESTTTPLEIYEKKLLSINAALDASKISEEGAARARRKVKEELETVNDDTKGAAKTARELGLAFTSAFEDAIVGGKGFREVVDGLGKDLLRVFIRKQLTEPLLEFFNVAAKGKGSPGGGGLGSIFSGLFGDSTAGSPAGDAGTGGLGGFFSNIFSSVGGMFGHGAAFQGGDVVPFARGGIVNRRSVFPMSRGRMGLMGEGGGEAVMRLGRTAQGDLGVMNAGGGSGGAVINIDARAAEIGVEQRIRQVVMHELAPMLTQMGVARVEQLANRGGTFSRAVGRRGR